MEYIDKCVALFMIIQRIIITKIEFKLPHKLVLLIKNEKLLIKDKIVFEKLYFFNARVAVFCFADIFSSLQTLQTIIILPFFVFFF